MISNEDNTVFFQGPKDPNYINKLNFLNFLLEENGLRNIWCGSKET